jgi:hypothetical protein
MMAAPKMPQMPGFKTFDMDALFAMQQANVETVAEAHQVMANAAYATLKMNLDFARGLTAKFTRFDPKTAAAKDQKDLAADAKSQAEDAMALLKANVEMGLEAQSKVADLIGKRVAANVKEAQQLAA